MRTILKVISIILIVTLMGCNNDDQINNIRSSEIIEVYIDGTLTDYSNNIIAKDYPLPASSGSTNIFRIISEDNNTNHFELSFPNSNVNPFVISIPSSELLSPSINHFLKIYGVNFDDLNPLNSLTVNYTKFGINLGDAIELDINGNYYEVGSSVSHTLYVSVKIKRD